VIGVMVDGVHGGLHPAVLLQGLSRIRVHVKAREIATADIHAEAVAFFEDIAGGIQPNGERVDFAWLQQLFLLQRVAEARSADAIGDV
jgi:hypothetical protein